MMFTERELEILTIAMAQEYDRVTKLKAKLRNTPGLCYKPGIQKLREEVAEVSTLYTKVDALHKAAE